MFLSGDFYIFSIMLMPPPQTRVKRLFEAIGVATGATGAEDGETNESKK